MTLISYLEKYSLQGAMLLVAFYFFYLIGYYSIIQRVEEKDVSKNALKKANSKIYLLIFSLIGFLIFIFFLFNKNIPFPFTSTESLLAILSGVLFIVSMLLIFVSSATEFKHYLFPVFEEELKEKPFSASLGLSSIAMLVFSFRYDNNICTTTINYSLVLSIAWFLLYVITLLLHAKLKPNRISLVFFSLNIALLCFLCYSTFTPKINNDPVEAQLNKLAIGSNDQSLMESLTKKFANTSIKVQSNNKLKNYPKRTIKEFLEFLNQKPNLNRIVLTNKNTYGDSCVLETLIYEQKINKELAILFNELNQSKENNMLYETILDIYFTHEAKVSNLINGSTSVAEIDIREYLKEIRDYAYEDSITVLDYRIQNGVIDSIRIGTNDFKHLE